MFFNRKIFLKLHNLRLITPPEDTSNPVKPTIAMFTMVDVEMFETDWIRHSARGTPQKFTLVSVGGASTFVAVRLKHDRCKYNRFFFKL